MILVYGLCLVSGLSLERRLPLNSLVQRAVMIFTGAAAQLVFCIQVLSLPRLLTGAGLIGANLGATLLVLAAGRFWPALPDRRSWRSPLDNAWRRVCDLRREPLALAIAGLALGAIVLYAALADFMIVNADPYHFEMPLFWIQHATILPFPVCDPRDCALSFAAEGLALPDFLYIHSPAAFAVLSGLGALMSLGIVFSLGRRLGASTGAAACAAGILTGYTLFAVTFITAQAAFYLAGLSAAAAALFLIDSRALATAGRPDSATLACSIACFAMACGAKNSTLLIAPAYLVGIFLVHRASWLRPRLLASLAAIGALGLLCSGVVWNYASNRLWYGNSGGPRLLQEALSHERSPRAIWTRVSRGVVLTAFDTIWIPNSLQPRYLALCRGALKVVGAKNELAEDNDYYGLPDRVVKPRLGLGLLGIVFFLPGLAWGAARWVRGERRGADVGGRERAAGGILVLMAVGAFVMCHAVMRWQSIGLLRLMPAFAVLGAPLAAPLLERRWAKGTALGLLALSTAMFLVFDLGLAARRWKGSQESALVRLISRFQQNHVLPVKYQWGTDPPQSMVLREDYSTREIYDKLFERVKQPAVFGFVGGLNSGCFDLFGKHFENRVIHLVDARTPGTIADPPPDAEYVVFAEGDDQAQGWAEARRFKPFFRVSKEDHCLFAVRQREIPGK